MTRKLSLALLALTALATLLALPDRPTRAAAPPADPAKDASGEQPIKALLILGGCCHDYAKQKDILAKGIAARANVEVTIAYDPDGSTKHLNPVYNNPDWAKGFDVVVHDECSADVKDLEMIERILKPHRDGLPAVVLHCAMHSYRSEGWPEQDTPWFQFTGLATTGHGPHEPLTIQFTDPEHPITRGMQGWTTGKEELYNNVRKPLEGTHVLGRGQQGKEDTVTIWTNAFGPKKTKVFGTTLGHANELVGDARYLDLVTRGLLWSVGKLDDQHFKPVKAAAATDATGRTKLASAAKTAEDEDCGCEEQAKTVAAK
jgi:type 1 glutamine amidotransferase